MSEHLDNEPRPCGVCGEPTPRLYLFSNDGSPPVPLNPMCERCQEQELSDPCEALWREGIRGTPVLGLPFAKAWQELTAAEPNSAREVREAFVNLLRSAPREVLREAFPEGLRWPPRPGSRRTGGEM